MPIQHAIWKVAAKPEALTVSKLATEKDLEDSEERRTSVFAMLRRDQSNAQH